MRPSKHATHSRSKAQEIFGISIARRLSKERDDLPLVATAEKDAITLFAWDQSAGRWRTARIPHADIETVRGAPSISNTWNWSRGVGLTAFDDLACVVYKRADSREASTAQLIIETFALNSGGPLAQVARTPVPMPQTFRPNPLDPRRPNLASARPGFELWAGVDAARRKLLIVTQTLGEHATGAGDGAELTLLIGDLDRLDQVDGWNHRTLDVGGYALDVRHHGDTLVLAYRISPQSLNLPFPSVSIDPFFSGPPQVEVDATIASDRFFTPLRLMRVDLSTLTTSKQDLPGGEHPRIQNIDPLMIVVDRPQLRVRFRAVIDSEGVAEPRVDWEVRGVHKLAYLLDDQQRMARGVLTSILQGDRPSLPRTAAPWVNVQDLYTDLTQEGLGWASTWPRFPLEPMRVDTDAKGLFFDFLNKSPWFALQRSRARLFTDFAHGVLTVTDLKSAVYDINHAQINAPESLRPDATGENAQFAPFTRLSQESNGPVLPPTYLCDNTIGGSLVSDRGAVSYQFVSYTDLGDGGLRVIFDSKLGAPDEPPQSAKPKELTPEAVPGPGSDDERWIELEASDWQDANVPAILLENLFFQRTITSALHAQLESMLQAGVSLAGLTVDEENGWSDSQVNSIQTALNAQVGSASAETRFSNDPVPRAFIRILPASIVADATTVWEAGIENEPVIAVAWTFTSHLTIFPPVITVAGNPVSVALVPQGDWTVRADITRGNGLITSFETVVTVGDSLFRRVAAVHRRLSEQGFDPPLDAIGNYRIGTTEFNLLQYDLRFPVASDDLNARRIVIMSFGATDAQWRFRADATEQGLIDYRLRIGFESEDFRLTGLIGALTKIERVRASFFYGRRFTPGILMNDTRSAAPVTGAVASSDGLRRGFDSASVPRLASALTARPHRDAQVTVDNVDVKVTMLPQAVAAAVITLLIGLGAATAATTLISLAAALGIAIAAAAAPLVGALAVAAVVAAAVAVFLFIALAVPPIVAASVAQNIRRGLTSARSVEGLEDARFLQFAGEGVAESIARQVINGAIQGGATLEAPPSGPEAIGEDRYRQDLYQMIHVSEGRCRVLLRA